MPIAALIGTIYVLSKLAANSEFTIMRVSGMSTRRLMMSLLGIGMMMVGLTFLLGEVISPPSERLAQQTRLKARGGQISVRDFRSGVWVRDVVKEPAGTVGAYRFINVRQVSPDVGTKDWRIIEFDSDYRLRSILRGKSAVMSRRRMGTDRCGRDQGTPLSTDATLTAARTEVLTIRHVEVGTEAGHLRRAAGAARAHGGAGTCCSTSITWPKTASRPSATRSPSGASCSTRGRCW